MAFAPIHLRLFRIILHSRKCPKFKIAILDEADLMTSDAQHALRRIIEDNSTKTRFCIICNYVTKVIEPLASRCVKFRFNPIGTTAQVEKLKEICQLEGVTAPEEVLMELIGICQGDLRRSITLLQTASSLYNKDLSSANISDMGGVIPHELMANVLPSIKASNQKELLAHAEGLISEGYSPEMFLNQFQDLILDGSYGLTEEQKAKIFESIAYTEENLVMGGSDFIQLYNLFVGVHAILTFKD